ncbi:MAG: DUF6600 domain-containing protein [Pseudomonadota bacterium]
MRLASIRFAALLALSLAGTAALADPPSRVGRIASTEGQVTLYAGADDQANPALLNWPVTGANRIVTAPGGSAEIRVGASAIRLDGDSELEVVALDDQQFHLFLNYGTVAARIGADSVAGFELSTTRARAALRQPGQLRIDTDRAPGVSVVSVVTGVAQVDGGGASLTVEAGNRADIGDGDVRTGQLVRDAFDNWPAAQSAATPALRYVSADTTGYEELDRYGSWSEDGDYGPLWQPRALPSGWAPYSDGRWTWVEPWGWTWVDNAPWGYAPSHYGRWVLVGQRWSWSPGAARTRQAWAPALVGWVGGNQWQARFVGRGPAPAVGWYPLPPRARYVPTYRVSPDYQRRLDTDHDGRWGERAGRPRRRERDDGRPEGVTLVPHDQFGSGRTVAVYAAPRAIMGVSEIHNLPLTSAPPFGAPSGVVDGRPRRADQAGGHEGDGARWRRGEAGGRYPDGAGRGGVVISTAPPVAAQPGQPGQPATAPAPRLPRTPPVPAAPAALAPAAPATVVLGAPGSGGRTVWNDRNDRNDRKDRNDRNDRAPQRPPVNGAPADGPGASGAPFSPPSHPPRGDVPDRARMRMSADDGHRAPPAQQAPPPVHAPAAAAIPAPAHPAQPAPAVQRAGPEAVAQPPSQSQHPERHNAGRERDEPRRGGLEGRREMAR